MFVSEVHFILKVDDDSGLLALSWIEIKHETRFSEA